MAIQVRKLNISQDADMERANEWLREHSSQIIQTHTYDAGGLGRLVVIYDDSDPVEQPLIRRRINAAPVQDV